MHWCTYELWLLKNKKEEERKKRDGKDRGASNSSNNEMRTTTTPRRRSLKFFCILLHLITEHCIFSEPQNPPIGKSLFDTETLIERFHGSEVVETRFVGLFSGRPRSLTG